MISSYIIRDIGNESAHKSIPIKPGDIDIAIEIVESLLKNVYIIPAETEKLDKKKISDDKRL